jgi:predicted RNA-binding protein with PUA-like domain
LTVPSYYLLKTEPTVYSFANLQRDKQTQWDGVSNPTAVKNLREMKPGDQLIIYHTGDEKTAVGTASVVSVKVTDLKLPVVEIKAGKSIAEPKSLAEIKSQKLFNDSPLVRQGRLSVVPLTAAQYEWLAGK